MSLVGRSASVLVAACTLLAACASGGGGASPPPPPPGKGTVVVVNETGKYVERVLVAAASTDDWIYQPTATYMNPGESVTLSLSAGEYHLRAELMSGAYVDALDVKLAAGTTYTWTVPPQAPGELHVFNKYTAPLDRLFITSAGASQYDWGMNRLTASIQPTETLTIGPLEAGLYDLKVVATDGHSWEGHFARVPAGGAFEWTVPPTGLLAVVNGSSAQLDYLYIVASPNGRDGLWGPDELEGWSVSAGSTLTIGDFFPGFLDVKAVSTAAGRTWTTYDVPIAAGETSTWTLSD